MQREEKKRARSGVKVMAGLIGMIKPLLPFMFIAILMGCAGNLMATFITILGGFGIRQVLGLYQGMTLSHIFILIAVFAVLRGILRYAEQASNHYIAFKLLAQIRHKVFAALRRLCPAKLDGSEKGNLISIITSDIELLEVFYAHTISPIAIAILTSGFMVWFLGQIHPAVGTLAAVFYLIVGAVIPVVNGKRGAGNGRIYRDSFGKLNTVVLDNLYGLDEILQYGQQENRLREMNRQTERLEQKNRKLKMAENTQRIVTDGVILIAGVLMAAICGYLAEQGKVSVDQAMVAVIAMISSFGPTAAISALSNNLQHTLASGNRVLDILEEEPLVEDILDGSTVCEGDISCNHISFAYADMQTKEGSPFIRSGSGKDSNLVLEDFDHMFAEHKIHGILGKSGCGKSTLLKLLMRFYETSGGEIRYGKTNVNEISTTALRSNISYVTQETFLFEDTIENNIKVAKENATREEVVAAAKKAALHEFILSLPDGYDTKLAELGDSVSGGERQRIGIARAFLHDGDMIFLDEPTSNIDSLNEGIILRSLDREKENKTILLVSHRKSTMAIADDVVAM
ncbi:MAG TPA: ABC transporter ATP-binding protein [Roseburia sp.]|nr:ABC transporter ATP-binding protein [Roseburia sp.]